MEPFIPEPGDSAKILVSGESEDVVQVIDYYSNPGDPLFPLFAISIVSISPNPYKTMIQKLKFVNQISLLFYRVEVFGISLGLCKQFIIWIVQGIIM